MTTLTPSLQQTIAAMRAQAPLVHNITNYVVMQQTANALLAIGASPVMAHAIEEVTDITKISGALVINIGTLSSPWIAAMIAAQQQAHTSNIPIVLDPVGVGASQLRTETARQLVKAGVSVVRGNGSEIIALAGGDALTKGVDSTAAADSAISAATQLSQQHGCVVIISGETDYIVDGGQVTTVIGGTELMTKVTGMGCTATALVGAFLAVCEYPHQASICAMQTMSLAAELALPNAKGPATFAAAFIDALYNVAQ